MPLRIAIDAMGGDIGPQATLPAVIQLAKKYHHVHFQVYGESDLCLPILGNHLSETIQFIPTSTSVLMQDAPTQALRHKRDSSMAMALKAVAEQSADGVISAGNTGALMAMGLHFLKKYEHIDRPALCQEIPTHGAPTYLLDLGANIECTADQLVQFACMGAALCSVLHQIPQPSVKMLNIGSEDYKGSVAVQSAAESLLKHPSLNYQGFIEGDALYQGDANVVVCDGFAGNIALKASEGVARFVAYYLKKVMSSSLYGHLIGCLAQPLFKQWQRKMDPDCYNGAYLLGVKGAVVKSHGGADSQQFRYALEMLIKRLQQQNFSQVEGALKKLLPSAV